MSKNLPFAFDFRTTRLSSGSRQQLANNLKAIKPDSPAAERKSRLLRFIENHAFDPARGFYVPISDHVYLKGKLPTHSIDIRPTDFPSSPFPFCFFTNPLVIPRDYRTDTFDESSALKPKFRATNVGWLIVTIEHDCQTTEQLEECLGWTRGKDGEFGESPFAEVDRALKRFKDYRGYTIVFSGRASIHFHLMFSTKHLENAPWDLSAEERLACSHSALMTEAYKVYWDMSAETFESALHPSLKPDDKLRTLTQWRRTPWAIRNLDKPSEPLGLPAGTIIPQMVIHENIMGRASTKAERFVVSPEFRIKKSRPVPSRRRTGTPLETSDPKLLDRIRGCCRDEWREYPKPMSVNADRGEWIIYFQNHKDDHKPSTFVKGGYRRLVLCGHHSFDKDLYLPDHMSADDLCEALSEKPEIPPKPHQAKSLVTTAPFPGQSLKDRLRGENFFGRQLDRIHEQFSEPVEETDRDTISAVHRARLGGAFSEVRRHFRTEPLIVRAPEGIGKTFQVLYHVSLDILDEAMSRDPHHGQKFACHASASIEQAEAKAKEYRESGKSRRAIVVKSFWKHYEAACDSHSITPLNKHQFTDHSINGILKHIKEKQSDVFDALEVRRKALWDGPDGFNLFNSGLTVIFSTHALAKGWHHNHLTRTWHHPSFEPFAPHDHDAFVRDLAFSEIVIDEPDIGLVLDQISSLTFDSLKGMKDRFPSWKNKTWTERYEAFKCAKNQREIPSRLEFDEFDDLMRLNLTSLDEQKVDFNAIPYGFDNKDTGIYSGQVGRVFYLGGQSWLKNCPSRITFLTTESVITDILIKAYETLPVSKPNVLDLYAQSGLFPIQVPLFIDARARKQKINEPINEILKQNPNSIIIANGIKGDDPRIRNFQGAKGSNDFSDKDVYVIPTCLAPDHYAELNVIGQWLNLPSIIHQHYEDEICQAVGRNTGFRKTGDRNKTILIAPNRLNRSILEECFRDASARIQLQRVTERPW